MGGGEAVCLKFENGNLNIAHISMEALRIFYHTLSLKQAGFASNNTLGQSLSSCYDWL